MRGDGLREAGGGGKKYGKLAREIFLRDLWLAWRAVSIQSSATIVIGLLVRFMFSFSYKTLMPYWIMLALSAGVTALDAQKPVSKKAAPQVIVPTGGSPVSAVRPVATSSARILYPWKTRVTCTIFWIGEQPSARNPTPNNKSSWDQQWSANFGGYDDPEPSNRIANHATGEFRPKNFIPKLNPFYIALPYNDVMGHAAHKPEASRVIPWFSRLNPEPGKTVCKGRWVQIYNGSRSCYAQWEDCGPWVTDDWEFVFGTKPPKTTQNGAAGIDLSPAIRDYLGLASGQKVHWRFLEAGQVPYGPWKKYGQETEVPANPDLIAQQKYLEYLRKLRDAEFQKKSLNEIQN
jgi:hypothetical protein